MLVSVIIPVYNAQAHLEQCLRSVMAQTIKDIEVICVDDGSTDNSAKILSRLAQEDLRLIVKHVTNGGAGRARNIGLDMARGTYLLFLDADDFFEPDMIEKAYRAAVKDDAQVTIFGADLYDQRSGRHYPCAYALRKDLMPENRPFAAQDVQKDLFRLVSGWTWDKLFLTSFIRENGLRFQEQRTTNDAYFVFCALAGAQRITTEYAVLVHQRRHAGVTLSVSREKSWMCFYDMLLALRDQLRTWGIYERFERDYINYALHFSLWNLNTLHGEVKKELYCKLKDAWFEQLDLLKRPKVYFYRGWEYGQMRRIMCHPYGKLTELESKLQRVRTFALHFLLRK